METIPKIDGLKELPNLKKLAGSITKKSNPLTTFLKIY